MNSAPLLAVFTSYSALHFIILAACLVLVVAITVAGVIGRGRSASHELRIRNYWIGFVVVVQGISQVLVNVPSAFNLQTTLPLHPCDIVPWIGVVALLSTARWMRATSVFWGLGLCIWAFILPIIAYETTDIRFWLFWLGHTQIIVTAVYLIAVMDYQPVFKDLILAFGVLAIFTVLIVFVNLGIGSDYGSLGQDSAAAQLGPWPGRIGILLVVHFLCFLIVYGVISLVRRLRIPGAN